jgi:hypothetical protein
MSRDWNDTAYEDYGERYRDDEPERGVCRRCKGLGYIPHRGEPMAADPCGCGEEVEDDLDEEEEDS